MARAVRVLIVAAATVLVTIAIAALRQASPSAQAPSTAAATPFDSTIAQNAQRMIAEGRRIFRFDTFGDEAFWGDQLKLHQAIVGQTLGGVGCTSEGERGRGRHGVSE